MVGPYRSKKYRRSWWITEMVVVLFTTVAGLKFWIALLNVSIILGFMIWLILTLNHIAETLDVLAGGM